MKKISFTDSEISDLLDLYQSEIDRAQRRINNLKGIIKKLTEKKEEPEIEKPIEQEKSKRGRKPKLKIQQPEKPTKEKKEEVKQKEVNPAIKKAPKDRKQKEKPLKEVVEVKKVEDKKEPKKRGRKKKEVEVKAVTTKKPEKKKKEVEVKATTPKKREKKRKTVKVKPAPKKRGRKPKSLRKPIKGGTGKEKVKWNDFILETITSKDSLMLASSLTQAALTKFQIPNSDRDRVRMAISTTLTKMTSKDKVLRTYSQPGLRGAFFGLSKWFNDKDELNADYKKKLM